MTSLLLRGDRVRVTAPDVFAGRLVGTVAALTAHSCVIKPEGREPLPLRFASVTSLEVSRGKKGSLSLRGGVIGFGIGFVPIYVMVGESDAAIDQLELLLSLPGEISTPLLRLDPTWDPLRDHPRFQALLEKYE